MIDHRAVGLRVNLDFVSISIFKMTSFGKTGDVVQSMPIDNSAVRLRTGFC